MKFLTLLVFLIAVSACTGEDLSAPLDNDEASAGGSNSDGDTDSGGDSNGGTDGSSACETTSCPGLLECIDVEGEAACVCPEGVECEFESCDDAPCSADAQCTDLPDTGFECDCNAGFSGNGFECAASDACDSVVCPLANQECVATDSVAKCQCREGYGGPQCTDINECEVFSGICGAFTTCNNFSGGYQCSCEPGFELVDGVCQDINECDADLALCDEANGECFNTVGSYECACQNSKFGDGFYCKDIDACDASACSNGSVCQNTPNGYQCICDSNNGGVNCATDCTSIVFADANLDNLVRDLIFKPTGTIEPQDLKALTSLTIPSSSAVTDLSGMECWSSLEELSIPDTVVSDLSYLKNLTLLKRLSAYCNSWTSLDPVAQLSQLEVLDVSRRIFECPTAQAFSSLSQLVNLKNLRELIISEHEFNSLSGIEALPRLEFLDARGNLLSTTNDIFESSRLQTLVVNNNQILEVGDLSTLVNLRRLIISNNQLSTLIDLSSIVWLNELDVSSNELMSLAGIEKMDSLFELDVAFNQISDVTPLASLNSASTIFVSSNAITSLKPLVDDTSFGFGGELWLGDNPLSCETQEIYLNELTERGLDIIGSCQEP